MALNAQVQRSEGGRLGGDHHEGVTEGVQNTEYGSTTTFSGSH